MDRKFHPRLGASLLAACAAIAVTTTECTAQDMPTPFAKRHTAPEAILVPMALDGRASGHVGWILSYRNNLRGSDAPNREIQTRQVTTSDQNEGTTLGSISWEITRTQNNVCPDWQQARCPDQIRVLSVPDGFMAVPEQTWIREGSGLRIYIVQVGMS